MTDTVISIIDLNDLYIGTDKNVLLALKTICTIGTKQSTKSLTFTEKHVPNPQHWGPGQSSGESTHEPLSHVQDGLQLMLLEVTVGHRRYFPQQSIQDLSIHLNRFLKKDNTTWRSARREGVNTLF